MRKTKSNEEVESVVTDNQAVFSPDEIRMSKTKSNEEVESVDESDSDNLEAPAAISPRKTRSTEVLCSGTSVSSWFKQNGV